MIKPTSDRKVGVEQTVKKWPEMTINLCKVIAMRKFNKSIRNKREIFLIVM